MGKVCCVPECNTGKKGVKKFSVYRVPKDELMFNKWMEKIPITRRKAPLDKKDFVCAQHFLPSDIDNCESFNINGQKVELAKINSHLKKHALPTLKLPLESNDCTNQVPVSHKEESPCKSLQIDNDNCNEGVNENIHEIIDEDVKDGTINTFSYTHIQEYCHLLDLPSTMWAVFKEPNGDFVSFSNLCIQNKILLKQVQFDRIKGSTPTVIFKEREVSTTTTVSSLKDIEHFLKDIDQRQTCLGVNSKRVGVNPLPTPTRYSRQCTGYVKPGKSRNKMQCAKCKKLELGIDAREKVRKSKNRALSLWRVRRQLKTMATKVSCLQERCKNASKSSLAENIKDLPKIQQDAILACVSAAQVRGSNGNRYTTEWIDECILMRLKSPKLYKHIRTRNILPLPSFTTLEKYIF